MGLFCGAKNPYHPYLRDSKPVTTLRFGHRWGTALLSLFFVLRSSSACTSRPNSALTCDQWWTQLAERAVRRPGDLAYIKSDYMYISLIFRFINYHILYGSGTPHNYLTIPMATFLLEQQNMFRSCLVMLIAKRFLEQNLLQLQPNYFALEMRHLTPWVYAWTLPKLKGTAK